VIGVIDPGITVVESCGLILEGLDSMGIDHELKGLVVAFFVCHV
jgi:hypothetical protein